MILPAETNKRPSRGGNHIVKTQWQYTRTWHRFRRHHLALLGASIILLLLLCGAFPQWLAPYDPLKVAPSDQGQLPTLAHPFGLDELGRDLLSRIIYGARIALIVGFGVTSLAMVVGLL